MKKNFLSMTLLAFILLQNIKVAFAFDPCSFLNDVETHLGVNFGDKTSRAITKVWKGIYSLISKDYFTMLTPRANWYVKVLEKLKYVISRAISEETLDKENFPPNNPIPAEIPIR